MKRLFSFIGDWAEIFIVLPIAVLLVLFGSSLLHSIDPTAAWIDSGSLSILLFNLVCLAVIYGFSFLVYKINFGDWFKNDWSKSLSPLAAGILNVVLWLSTLAASAWVLLRNT